MRRLHPDVHERVIRLLQESLDSRFEAALTASGAGEWERIVSKWVSSLSNAVQLSSGRGS